MSITISPLFALSTTWLTPLWLISAGVTVGVVILAALFGIVWLARRSLAERIAAAVKESILLPISYFALVLVVLTLLGMIKISYKPFLASLMRLPARQTIDEDAIEIPAQAVDQVIESDFYSDELRVFRLESSEDILVTAETVGESAPNLFLVEGGESRSWVDGAGRSSPFQGHVRRFLVSNESDAPAKVSMLLVTDVELPQVIAIPVTAISMVGLYLVFLGVYLTMPKISAIAATTTKEAIAQPIFLLALIIGGCAMVAFIYIPYHTFGEDVKVLESSALSLIMVLAILVALWTASVSIADEIEGRTALTLLSKPISRRQFIFGKFIGVVWPVVLMYVALGSLLMVTISFKVVYESHESGAGEPAWQECYAEVARIMPALVLSLMATLVLASISVAISTRLPMLPNLMICSSIFVLGNLTPAIVGSSIGQFEAVAFMGRLIATVLPVLDHWNVEAAVAGGAQVPLAYLPWALLYMVLYCTIAMLVALLLIEDRDLA